MKVPWNPKLQVVGTKACGGKIYALATWLLNAILLMPLLAQEIFQIADF